MILLCDSRSSWWFSDVTENWERSFNFCKLKWPIRLWLPLGALGYKFLNSQWWGEKLSFICNCPFIPFGSLAIFVTYTWMWSHWLLIKWYSVNNFQKKACESIQFPPYFFSSLPCSKRDICHRIPMSFSFQMTSWAHRIQAKAVQGKDLLQKPYNALCWVSFSPTYFQLMSNKKHKLYLKEQPLIVLPPNDMPSPHKPLWGTLSDLQRIISIIPLSGIIKPTYEKYRSYQIREKRCLP